MSNIRLSLSSLLRPPAAAELGLAALGHTRQDRDRRTVAAACSGIRSLTVTLAFFSIYGFVAFRVRWKTAVIIGAAFPLAVAGNVFRLALIILAAEVTEAAQAGAGQAAGNFVHSNGILSLLPYVPAFVGVLFLGRLIKEDGRSVRESEVGGE